MSATPPFILEIDGREVDPPENWRNIIAKMTFDEFSAQADIDIDSFILVNEAHQMALAHRDLGLMTEGLGFALIFQDAHATSVIRITGYINLLDNWQIISPVMCKVKVVFHGTANHITTRIGGLTYEALRSRGRILAADYTRVPYLIIKEFNEGEFITLEVTIFLVARELIQLAKELGRDLVSMAALISGGFPGTGAIAAVAAALFNLLLNIAYGVAMLDLLRKLMVQLVEKCYQTSLPAYGMTYRKALSKVCEEIGYTLYSPIAALDTDVYLPSKPQGTETGSLRKNQGIPNPQDPGYGCGEMLEIIEKKFNARLQIDEANKIIKLYSVNDPAWYQQQNYVMPDMLREEKTYNTDALENTLIISYQRDPSDWWTGENYKGTAYERTTSPLSVGVNDNIAIKGLKEVRIPLALGNRKADLTELETKLLAVATAIDDAVKKYGGTILILGAKMNQQGAGANQGIATQVAKSFAAGNLAGLILNRTNMLKVGSPYWEIPKDIYFKNGGIPADHRDHVSAKAVYDNYYAFESLVGNNFAGQKAVFKDQTIPFTQEHFLQVAGNKYFTFSDGTQGEFFGTLDWSFGDDTATASFRKQETWCPRIKEDFTEPA